MANGNLPGQVNINDPIRARQNVRPLSEAYGGGIAGAARVRAFRGFAGFGAALGDAAESIGDAVQKRKEEQEKEKAELAEAEASEAHVAAYQEAKDAIGDPETGIFVTHKGIKARGAESTFYDNMNEIEKRYADNLSPEAKERFLDKFRRDGMKLQGSLQDWARTQLTAAKRGNMQSELENSKDNARMFSDEPEKLANEEKEFKAKFQALADFEGLGDAERKDRWEAELSEFHDSGLTALLSEGKIAEAEKYLLKHGHKLEYKRSVYLSNHLKKIREGAAIQSNVDRLEKNVRNIKELNARRAAVSQMEKAGYKVVPLEDFKSRWDTFNSGEEFDSTSGHALKLQIEDIRARILAHPEEDYVSKEGRIMRTNKDKKFTKDSLIQKLKELESLVDTALEEGSGPSEDVLDMRELITDPKLLKEFDKTAEGLKAERRINAHSRNKAVAKIFEELEAFNEYTSGKQEAFVKAALRNVKGAELTADDERMITRSIEASTSGEMRDEMLKEVQQRFRYRREQAERIRKDRIRDIENAASQMKTPTQLKGLKYTYGPEYYKVIEDIKEDRWGEEIEELKSKSNANLMRTMIDRGAWSYVDRKGVVHTLPLRSQEDVLEAIQTLRHEKNLRLTKTDLNNVLRYQANGPVSMTKFKDALEALTGSRKMDDYQGLYDIIAERMPQGREVSMEDIKSELAQWFVRDKSLIGKGKTAYKHFVEEGTLKGFDIAIPDVDSDFADQDEAVRRYLRAERRSFTKSLGRQPTDTEFRNHLKKRIAE